jgi:hypothetical protein
MVDGEDVLLVGEAVQQRGEAAGGHRAFASACGGDGEVRVGAFPGADGLDDTPGLVRLWELGQQRGTGDGEERGGGVLEFGQLPVARSGKSAASRGRSAA